MLSLPEIRALVRLLDYVSRETELASPLTAYLATMARQNLVEERWRSDGTPRSRNGMDKGSME